MNQENVTRALQYFEKFQKILGAADGGFEEKEFAASDVAKANFLFAIIDDLISSKDTEIPEMLGGLTLVVDTSYSGLPYSLFSEKVDSSVRVKFAEKIYTCFEKIFDMYSGSGSMKGVFGSQLDSLCFMWWELLPRHGVPFKDYLREGDIALLSSMRRILVLENSECKRSALHGLGLWHLAYPFEVISIITECAEFIPEHLKSYAAAAAKGNL